MDFFKNDNVIFSGGGIKSAFKWSLLLFLITFIFQVFGIVLVLAEDSLSAILFLAILPFIALFLIYYFALKKEIPRIGLTTYSLRFGYLVIITIFILIFSFLSTLILTGEFQFPRIGILSIILMWLVPYFVKE